MPKLPYADEFDADTQISAEEAIAAHIFDSLQDGESEEPPAQLSEDFCAQMGRDILYLVLSKFRPDLLATT